jgi:hypothetical protein
MYDVTIAVAKRKDERYLIAERALKKVEALGRSHTRRYKYNDNEIMGTRQNKNRMSLNICLSRRICNDPDSDRAGIKESLIVAAAVPVTLALTILVNYVYGYTLNRVTLFSLIFSIGILVDDAIVVVENIHRHFSMKGVSPETAISAVDEVGNPTILATFTVIAALLPMAFVSGLMGPYMRPIPIGASAAMLISLLIAFIISPWLSFIVLKKAGTHKEGWGEQILTF